MKSGSRSGHYTGRTGDLLDRKRPGAGGHHSTIVTITYGMQGAVRIEELDPNRQQTADSKQQTALQLVR